MASLSDRHPRRGVKYRPNAYAVSMGCPSGECSVRRKRVDGYAWRVFYRGSRKVWQCNPGFFAAHFSKVS